MEDIKLKVLEIINEVLSGKGEPLVDDFIESTTFRDELGFDSFDLAELTIRIEEEFDVDVFANGIIETCGELLKKIA